MIPTLVNNKKRYYMIINTHIGSVTISKPCQTNNNNNTHNKNNCNTKLMNNTYNDIIHAINLNENVGNYKRIANNKPSNNQKHNTKI